MVDNHLNGSAIPILPMARFSINLICWASRSIMLRYLWAIKNRFGSGNNDSRFASFNFLILFADIQMNCVAMFL